MLFYQLRNVVLGLFASLKVHPDPVKLRRSAEAAAMAHDHRRRRALAQNSY
jgi:hypothetical protein